VCSYGAKIYRVIYITIDPLVYENVFMITSLPTKRISISDITVKNISKSFTHKMAAKAAGAEITSLSSYVYIPCPQTLPTVVFLPGLTASVLNHIVSSEQIRFVFRSLFHFIAFIT